MTTLSDSAVVQAFLTDHRKFMKLLREVTLALHAGDLEQARQLGKTLNEIGGSHVAFEETVLYPALDRQTSNRAFVAGLYDEHESLVSALARLLGHREFDDRQLERQFERQLDSELDSGIDSEVDGELGAEGLAELRAAFEKGLEHAEHCGTLISRLCAFDDVEQQAALDELQRLRDGGVAWLELKKGA